MRQDNEIEKPFFFWDGSLYTGNAPTFYTTAEFVWAKVIEENWHVIKEEMLDNIQPEAMPVPNHNPNLVVRPEVWRNICFVNYLWKKKATIKRYPKTWMLLKQIPNLSYAALNMLEPHSEIKPHHGDTNITARCHLGLQIPAPLPHCGLEVNGHQIGWQQGKLLAFSDAHLHRAWNHTPHYRFVMVIDVVLPQYATQKTTLCAKTLSALTLKAIGYKFPILQRSPKLLGNALFATTALLWRVFLKIQ